MAEFDVLVSFSLCPGLCCGSCSELSSAEVQEGQRGGLGAAGVDRAQLPGGRCRGSVSDSGPGRSTEQKRGFGRCR